MEHANLNVVDYAVIVILLLSALLALMRGFVRELMSLCAWTGASLIGTYYYPVLKPMMLQHVKSEQAATIAAMVLMFCASLAVLLPLGILIASMVRGKALTAVDRSLGLIFGLLRGGLIVALMYLLTMWIWPTDPPEILKTARLQPVLADGAEMLRVLVPKEDKDKLTSLWQKKQDSDQKAVVEHAQQMLQGTPPVAGAGNAPAAAAGTATPAASNNGGYSKEEIDAVVKAMKEQAKP